MAGQFHESDFQPTAPWEILRLRAQLLGVVRRFFELRGYLEVETPLLSHDVVVDAWLEPFSARFVRDGTPESAGSELFLQTSPEFAMKRLLAAGGRAIYQITRSFRQGELGRLHNPEFTMVEWYRVGDTYLDQMHVAEALLREVLAAASGFFQESSTSDGMLATALRGQSAPLPRIRYDAAFERALGTRVLHFTAEDLSRLAASQGIAKPPGLAADDRDGWLNLLLNAKVEPYLKTMNAVFVHDYPASQAALARIRDADPPVAERFELYLKGIEVCNGYQELTDPSELRRRIGLQNDLRRRDGRRALPETNRLLAAMEAGLPECAGVALGFDRLMMLVSDAESLPAVMAFPFDRA